MMARPGGRFSGDYVRYWAGAMVSILGSSLSAIAYPLLVIAMGGSAAQAGAVGSASLITRTVCRLPGGHIADLISPRAMMIGTDLVRLIVVGSVPAAAMLGSLSYPQLLVVATIEGVATALYQPSYTVLLRDLVPKELLTSALSQTQTTIGTIAMLGPLAGGALFGVDRTLPFTLDAASYAISLLFLLTVRAPVVDRAADGKPDRRPTAGLRWLWRQPGILRVLLLVGVINMVAAGMDIPIMISLRGQGLSGAVFGAVLGAAGVGLVLGALLAPRLLARLPGQALYLLIGLVWIGGTAVLVVEPGPWVMGVILVGLMALAPAVSIKLNQLTLDRVPRNLVGRVTTAQGMVTAGLSAVGPGLAGVLLSGYGLTVTWLALALACLLATGVTVAPSIRERRTAEAARGVPDGDRL